MPGHPLCDLPAATSRAGNVRGRRIQVGMYVLCILITGERTRSARKERVANNPPPTLRATQPARGGFPHSPIPPQQEQQESSGARALTTVEGRKGGRIGGSWSDQSVQPQASPPTPESGQICGSAPQPADRDRDLQTIDTARRALANAIQGHAPPLTSCRHTHHTIDHQGSCEELSKRLHLVVGDHEWTIYAISRNGTCRSRCADMPRTPFPPMR